MTDKPSTSGTAASNAAATSANATTATPDPFMPRPPVSLRARMIEDMAARNLNRKRCPASRIDDLMPWAYAKTAA